MADAAYITNSGLGILTNLTKVGAAAEPHHVGWGTGGTGAAITDTALQTAAAEARVVATSSREQTTVANDTYRLVAPLVSAAGATITEVAAFDDATAGTLFMHGTFTGIVLAVGDGITFTINNVFSR